MEPPKLFRETPLFLPRLLPLPTSSRTPVTKISPSPSYRFFSRPTANSPHGFPPSSQAQPALPGPGLHLLRRQLPRWFPYPAGRYPPTIAEHPGRRLLLPLRTIPHPGRLRHDVRLAEIPLPLVGHFLR